MVDVRTAVAADVSAIQRVARASWHAAYGDFVADPAIEEMLAEWYSDEAVERGVTSDEVRYLVAEGSDDGILGYASTGPADEEGIAVLASIYVLPERWGEGIGTGLLKAAIERLRERGFERLRATVLADNDVGVAFYDRQGFERTGRHEEELGGETHDALVVERPL